MATTDSFDRIDSREQQRKGRFRIGQRSAIVAGVRVEIEWTFFAQGRQRAWYRCPRCNNRMAILICTEVGLVGCRHCFHLIYRSQLEDAFGKACLQADKIRKKLGWPPGIANGLGQKPPKMRWTTYLQLKERYRYYVFNVLERLSSSIVNRN